MKKIILATSMLLFLHAPYAASAEYVTNLDDQQKISVTIYNQNLALIKDKRTITMPAGRNTLAFREVSGQIKPETALLTANHLTILEQNFEYDLLTPAALLEKYVGREVTVVKTHPTTGEETSEKAKVLSANSGVVLQMGDNIETGIPGRLVFGDVPQNLRDRPTLTMLVQSNTAKSQEVELSYLSNGLGWQADYVAELNSKDTAMELGSWVTLTNTSGATYRNANLQLVAGDVHQAPSERQGRQVYRKQMAMAEAAMDGGMAEEQMFEYHLYTLERPTSIADKQTKQVSLLQASQVPCRKEFILQGSSHYYQSQYGEIGRKMKIAVFVEIQNSKKNNLGLPLPKGVVRVYKKDSQERLQFVGEDRIDHTPENETIRLKLGEAFDITANKKQMDFKKLSGFSRYNYVYESAYSIELKNGKKEAVTVKVVEPIPGDWDMLEESHTHKKATSNTAVWMVEVPPLGATELTYRVRVKH
ncbi:MAG: DUF4139 domain-containing protein [Desulfobulbaceae bacterium]|nr:DUF4139 domain-containing protein [Desulfobulbaceae bacterium]